MSNYLNTPVDEVSYEEILANKDNYHHWNYQSVEPVSHGYEDVLDLIHTYSYDRFTEAGKEGKTLHELLAKGQEFPDSWLSTKGLTVKQNQMVDEILALYRERNIFPINYYSDLGVSQEIQRCIEYKAEFDGDTVSTGVGVGTGLCNFFQPVLFDTASIQDADKISDGSHTMYGKFLSDKYLRRAIAFCFNYKDGDAVPSYVAGGLRLVGSAPTNFRPMNAKAIWERFAPENGVVFDTSCGFGGRLLGALSSRKNLTYVGTDPSMEAMYNNHRLGQAIEMVTGRTGSYEFHCCGSELEDLVEKESWADVHFSSPPYFELEQYGDHDANNANQSHVKFPGLENWLEGYVRGTCKNIYKALKPGGYSIVNIADFTTRGSGRVSFVDEWKRIAMEEGLTFFTNIYLGVNARAGSLEQEMGVEKKEVILVFQADKNLW